MPDIRLFIRFGRLFPDHSYDLGVELGGFGRRMTRGKKISANQNGNHPICHRVWLQYIDLENVFNDNIIGLDDRMASLQASTLQQASSSHHALAIRLMSIFDLLTSSPLLLRTTRIPPAPVKVLYIPRDFALFDLHGRDLAHNRTALQCNFHFVTTKFHRVEQH